MTWDISTEPKSFDEAIAQFRGRFPLTKAQWDKLTTEQRAKAFTVAGVMQLDLVADVYTALLTAIENGGTVREFRAAIEEKLAREWGDEVDAPSRLDTVFRTNVQSAYGAGRYEQATDPDVLESHPYMVFEAVGDSRTSSICREHDGLVMPTNDPRWAGRLPPVHHACRSTTRTISEDEARELGVAVKPPAVKASGDFGAVPTKSEWAPNKADYPSALWAAHQARTGE